MKKSALIILTVLIPLLTFGRRQNTGPAKVVAPAAEIEAADTIRTDLKGIVLSGYDKPNQAVREAFFVTNNHPDSIGIAELNVTLTYFDLKGRMLHEATHTVKCEIPAGKTHRIEVPSWDRNCAFHYFRSQAPKRRASTPYRVSSQINYILPIR